MLVEAALFGALLVGAIFLFRLGWFVHIVIALGAIFTLALTHLRWKKPFALTGFLAVLVYLLFMGVFALTQVFIWNGFTNIKKRATFEMTWSFGEPSSQWPNAKHIIFTFVDYPNHRIGIYSTDLSDHLASLPQRTVPVEFETTWDFGRMRGYNETRIGELTNWNMTWGYGGTTGDYEPAPWDSM